MLPAIRFTPCLRARILPSCSQNIVDIQCTGRQISSTACCRQTSDSPVPLWTSLPKPRLDYKFLVENEPQTYTNVLKRKANISEEQIVTLSKQYKDQKKLSSELNAKIYRRNGVETKVKATGVSPEEKRKAIEEARVLKVEIQQMDARLSELEEQMLQLGLIFPNNTHPESPVGPEEESFTLYSYADDVLPPSPLRDHVAIGRALGILELDAAAATTGNSWYYLLNEGALLEMALVQYAMSRAIARGYKPVLTPDVVKSDIAARCGFNPRDQGSTLVHHMYHLQNWKPKQPELVLSGTAEIPLTGFFANKIIPHQDLPQYLVGFGHAFRSEAGARGADTRGIYRVHQFSKVELFVVCAKEDSNNTLERMVDLQIDIIRDLCLPMKVLNMATEELGATAYQKIDINVWMPGRADWGEVSSASNCTDYQSRRMHIRYRPNFVSVSAVEADKKERIQFAHTLNGTAMAVPRIIVALLENGVTFDENNKIDGLKLPNVLKPFWLGGETCGPAKIRWI